MTVQPNLWDIRNLNRRGSTLWRPLVSIDLTADETPVTGSRRLFVRLP